MEFSGEFGGGVSGRSEMGVSVKSPGEMSGETGNGISEGSGSTVTGDCGLDLSLIVEF